MSGDLSRSNAQSRNAIQRRKGPSFFFTTDIDAAQGVEDGVIVTSVVLGHSLFGVGGVLRQLVAF